MKTSRRGFSLIELMVALTIGSFLSVGAVSVYSSTRQTNRIQGMQSRLSEDGRFALSMLRRVISQAGFRPSPGSTFDETTRLTSMSSTAMTLAFTSDGTNTISCDSSVAAANSAVSATLTVDTANKKLQCTVGGATTDWIAPPADGNGTELIDGKFEYGEDTVSATTNSEFQCGSTTRDCVADSYVTSPTTNAAVVAVRVCFVLRSQITDVGVAKASTYKNCSGTAISGSDTDKKLYRTFRSTILVRNR